MIKNKWNLEAFKKNTYKMFIGNPEYIIEKDEFHYLEKDVDTCRKLIIQDIENTPYLRYKNVIVDIINKRFGNQSKNPTQERLLLNLLKPSEKAKEEMKKYGIIK